MLINFKFKNFRSFYDEMNFSMLKGKKKELSSKIIIGPEDLKLLPTKVIYGGNAAGKTSIVLGAKLLKEIILNKGINPNAEKINMLLANIPIYHFIHEEKKFFEPIELSISFIHDKDLFDYDLKIESYEDHDSMKNKISYEKLIINNKEIFVREDKKITFSKSKEVLTNYYDNEVTLDYLKKTEDMLFTNYTDEGVFTSWFYTINKKLVDRFTLWFKNEFLVFLDLDEIKYNIKVSENETKDEVNLINEYILKLLKKADFGPQKIAFKATKQENGSYITNVNSIYELRTNSDKKQRNIFEIDSQFIESKGTLKILNLMGPFISAILNGATIIIDELASSIHPEIVAGIIKVFSDKEINDKGAQLIFTTHNPIFLNNNLFRRDEIVFVEKDQKNYRSTCFTLDDIDIRQDQQYLKNYLEGKYTIFPYIDFGSIVSEIKKKGKIFLEQ